MLTMGVGSNRAGEPPRTSRDERDGEKRVQRDDWGNPIVRRIALPASEEVEALREDLNGPVPYGAGLRARPLPPGTDH